MDYSKKNNKKTTALKSAFRQFVHFKVYLVETFIMIVDKPSVLLVLTTMSCVYIKMCVYACLDVTGHMCVLPCVMCV